MSSDISRLSEVADVVDSLHKTPVYSAHGLPMVRVTDVKYGELSLVGCHLVEESVFLEFSRRYEPRTGDIIITRVGTYGVSALVRNPNFCLGQNTAAIIPRKINPRYLYAALNSDFVRDQIEAGVVGSTQKTLSLRCIKELQVPRCGEENEKWIAEIVGGLDDRITLLRETNATLEAIAQALFKSWFVDFDPVHAKCAVQGRTNAAGAGGAGAADDQGRTNAASAGSAGAADVQGRTNAASAGSAGAAAVQGRTNTAAGAAPARTAQTDAQPATNTPPGTAANTPPTAPPAEAPIPGLDPATAALFPDSFEETELGLVPKGWRVMPFLDACDLQGGAQPPASTFIDHEANGYVRLLQIRDFSTDTHKTYIPDTSKLKKAAEDDVLIGRYGSASGDKARDSLGRVCRGLSGAYNVALMKLCPVEVGREFAYQMVCDPRFYGYLQGVSSKAVQSGFSKGELGQYRVVVPPRQLADHFEQIGLDVWHRVKANNQQAQTLTQLRDTLLPRLISGQLRLPEAEQLIQEQAHA